MRSWGVFSEAELSDWLGRNGFPATQPGHHIAARTQEHILTAVCRVDARVGLLESAFVKLTLSEGRQRASGTSRRHTNERRHSTAIPAEVPRDSWEQSVLETSSNVEERPSFQAETVSPQFDSHIAGAVPSEVGWRQGWRRASLESVRPRTCNVVAQNQMGRIGRVELVERANKFARGQWADVLEELCHSTHSSRPGVTRSMDSTCGVQPLDEKDAEQKDAGRQPAKE